MKAKAKSEFKTKQKQNKLWKVSIGEIGSTYLILAESYLRAAVKAKKIHREYFKKGYVLRNGIRTIEYLGELDEPEAK